MNLLKISWKYLFNKPLSTGLNVLILALGLAMITVLLLIQDQFEKKMNQDATGIDLVVGAKGSPLQLILSSVYHLDFPTGNIKMEEAQRLSRNRLVKQIVPLALGDNYQGYRLVGSNHDYLELYGAEFAQGEAWEKPFQVTLGAEVARKLQLQLGDQFASSHGISVGSHDHDAFLFEVTGILKPKGNVIDRLILTSIESVWFSHDEEEGESEEESEPHIHEEGEDHNHDHARDKSQIPVAKSGFPVTDQEREVTTLLLQFRNPMAAIQLPRMINSGTSMQAASPSFEMNRLFELLGVGVSLLKGIAFVLIAISGLGIFIALYNS
ncbi:MAG: ABC transporter permease, partial [Algoriphagus sp. 32-45-6]